MELRSRLTAKDTKSGAKGAKLETKHWDLAPTGVGWLNKDRAGLGGIRSPPVSGKAGWFWIPSREG